MLRNKANQSRYGQDAERKHSSQNPSSLNERICAQLVRVSEFFPVASDNVSGNAAITAGEISRPHKAISYEATFWKMLRLRFLCEEASVSRGGWGSPSTDDSSLSLQGKRVFGVNSSYRAPAQGGRSENVVDYNFRFAHSNTWIPEQQPGEITKPNVNPYFGEQHAGRLGGKGKDSNSRKGHSQHRHDFARARSNQLRLHVSSFTQSTPQGGAEL